MAEVTVASLLKIEAQSLKALLEVKMMEPRSYLALTAWNRDLGCYVAPEFVFETPGGADSIDNVGSGGEENRVLSLVRRPRGIPTVRDRVVQMAMVLGASAV